MTSREKDQLRGFGLYAESLEHLARVKNIPYVGGSPSKHHAVMAGERLGIHLAVAQRSVARWQTATVVVGLFGLVGWVRSFLTPTPNERAKP